MNTMSPSQEVSFVGNPTNLNFVHQHFTKEPSMVHGIVVQHARSQGIDLHQYFQIAYQQKYGELKNRRYFDGAVESFNEEHVVPDFIGGFVCGIIINHPLPKLIA